MGLSTTVIFLLALFILHWIYQTIQYFRTFPPGPWLPIPLLTRFPLSKFYKKNILEIVQMLQEEKKGVFSLNLGNHRVVMLNHFESIKHLFSKKFVLRPEKLKLWRGDRYGLIFVNGDDWKIQRRMLLELMKSSSFARSAMTNAIELVWPSVREILSKAQEYPQAGNALDLAIVEIVVLSFCDPSVFPNGRPSRKALEYFNITRTYGVQWCEFELWYKYPILKSLAPQLSGYTRAMNNLKNSNEELKKMIQWHEDYPSETRHDFIDIYLEKLKEVRDDHGNLLSGQSGYKSLLATLDNIIVGADGIMMQMISVLLALSKHPEIQDKLRSEADLAWKSDFEVFPDKSAMPYNIAFQMEILRFVNQSGFGGAHQASHAVEVEGYVIPPKTDVFPNLDMILKDRSYWKDFDVFKPERFLDENGKIISDSRFIPFQTGPRMCPGRSFAMDVLVLITSRIVKEFQLSFSESNDGKTSASNKIKPLSLDDLEFLGMSLILPKPFVFKTNKLYYSKC